ncbi:uncharacterized protein mbl isoform X33 [Drosophila suzukii]|uniref:Uncharacterized protein mbl isoform X33 n=1 Tax=Drosophila suzukii TaxID=28584 RepID=A0AB40D5U5_DROSZ
MANVVNMNSLLNGKDSRWLQLEVCREFQRNKCSRQDTECKFAHPPANVEVQNGKVTACYDSIKVSLLQQISLFLPFSHSNPVESKLREYVLESQEQRGTHRGPKTLSDKRREQSGKSRRLLEVPLFRCTLWQCDTRCCGT